MTLQKCPSCQSLRRAGPPQRGQAALTERGVGGQRGASLTADLDIMGQHDREIFLLFGHDATGIAIDHGNPGHPNSAGGLFPSRASDS